MSDNTPCYQLPVALSQAVATPPRVVISACLAGEPVRYDGNSKTQTQVLPLLQRYLQLQHQCPEVAAGMGVPRPPVHWVETGRGELRLQQVDNPDRRHDTALQIAVEGLCQQPAPVAAVLKARSPSCGAGTTPVVDREGALLRLTDGLFTRTLRQRYPALAIVDEQYFLQPRDGFWFVFGCYLACADPLPRLLAQQLGWQESLTDFLSLPCDWREQQLQLLV